MVAHLVGDDVGLGEVAGGAEAAVQLVEEGEVEVDPLIGRAIKRPHRRRAEAAGRLHGVGEQHQPGLLVGPARRREDPVPGVLGVG